MNITQREMKEMTMRDLKRKQELREKRRRAIEGTNESIVINVNLNNEGEEIKMKDFYGKVSFSGNINFTVTAIDEETAKELVFEDIEGIDILLKDGTTVSVCEVEWGLIDEARRGNVRQSYISDFDMQEER